MLAGDNDIKPSVYSMELITCKHLALKALWNFNLIRSAMPSASRDGTTYTSYFVPGYMISRQVMFSNVHYFLGPQASVRAFTYQQREGYLINNPGGPLTKVNPGVCCSVIQHLPMGAKFHCLQNQIEDLQYLSQQYEQQEAARMARASGALHSGDFYVNKPIPVQQRHREGAAQLR